MLHVMTCLCGGTSQYPTTSSRHKKERRTPNQTTHHRSLAALLHNKNQPELPRFSHVWLCREVSCCPVPSVVLSVCLAPLLCQTSPAKRTTCMYNSSPNTHRTPQLPKRTYTIKHQTKK